MQANGFFRQGQPYRAVDGRVVVVQQGKMTLEIDLEEYRLQEGDIAVMMPDALVMATDIGADSVASAVIFRRLPSQAAQAESFVLSGDDVAYSRVKPRCYCITHRCPLPKWLIPLAFPPRRPSFTSSNIRPVPHRFDTESNC